MKIAVIIIRTLLGLLLLFASITYFFKIFPQPELSGSVKTFNEGLAASRYLMPLVKAIELLCGISFVTGRFVTLAAIIFFPIAVNILLFHAFLATEGLPSAIFVFAGDLFLAYYYRKNYETLFMAK